MLRRIAFVAVVLAAGLIAGDSAPEQARGQDRATVRQPQFVHTVIFYLKNDAPHDAAEGLVKDAHEMLAKIPSVRGIKAGRPAAHATPDVSKKDFQVGLLVMFDDSAGLKAYLEHPLHLKYVEKHGKNIDMSKLLVYDFANQEK